MPTTTCSRPRNWSALRSGGCARWTWIRRTPPAVPRLRPEVLAGDVRRMRDSPLFRENIAICNWLGESDGIVDFMDMANDYRAQDRCRSFARERRGLPARSDRSGKADVRRGVKRALSLRGPHRPFGRLRLDETGAASMFTSPTQWERSARSAG